MRRKVVGFSILMFVSFSVSAMVTTQAIPFLTEMGYSPSQRGNIMAFYAAVALVGQLVVGYICDRQKTVKRFFILLNILFAGFIFLTFTLQTKNYLLHFMFMSGMLAFSRIVGNLLETWIIEVDGMYPYFGGIRSLGSLGWAVASLGAGYLILFYNFQVMAYVAIVLNMIVIAYSFMMEDADKKETRIITFSDMKLLFTNKKFTFLLLIYVLIYIIYNTDSIIITDLILSVGGSAADVGKKWFVQALSELPFMIMGTYLLTRFKGKLLLLVGIVFLALRFALYALFPTLTAIIVVSALQMVSFPLILLSQKELTLNETPVELRTSGQMISISFTSGFAAILAPILTGYLGEIYSIQHIIMGLAVLLVIPFVLTIFFKHAE